MSLIRLVSVLIKEYRHILRDPRTLWMVFLSPAFVLLALSALFASGVGQIDLAVWDHDQSDLSRQFAGTLGSDDDFTLLYVFDYETIERLLVDTRIDAALVIPPGFDSTIRSGQTAPVQVVLDGVDTGLAGQVMGSLLGHAADFAVELSHRFSVAAPPVQVYPQSVYLSGSAERNSMIPGLVPMVFTLPAMAAALALARDRETGSLESLITSPVRGLEYLLGKLFAYVTTALVGLLPVWLEATVIFGVPFRGSPLLLVLLTTDFLLACMAMAVFIGSAVRSQQTATVAALFVFFVPGFFLAGLIDPVDTTNVWGAAMSYALPMTHFVTISRALFIKGASLVEVWQPALMLLGLSAAWIGLGTLLFKKRIRA